jgi:NAD(P)H-hydrate repair Nnr-like enzyme with NAD(P)H-hydrate epimerase domain
MSYNHDLTVVYAAKKDSAASGFNSLVTKKDSSAASIPSLSLPSSSTADSSTGDEASTVVAAPAASSKVSFGGLKPAVAKTDGKEGVGADEAAASSTAVGVPAKALPTAEYR